MVAWNCKMDLYTDGTRVNMICNRVWTRWSLLAMVCTEDIAYSNKALWPAFPVCEYGKTCHQLGGAFHFRFVCTFYRTGIFFLNIWIFYFSYYIYSKTLWENTIFWHEHFCKYINFSYHKNIYFYMGCVLFPKCMEYFLTRNEHLFHNVREFSPQNLVCHRACKSVKVDVGAGCFLAPWQELNETRPTAVQDARNLVHRWGMGKGGTWEITTIMFFAHEVEDRKLILESLLAGI